MNLDEKSKVKRGRKQIRGVKDGLPERAVFTLRMEAHIFEALNQLLGNSKHSRNEYVVNLIQHDLAIRQLVSPVDKKSKSEK